MNNKVQGLTFKSSEEIREFINSNESGLYSGINADGIEVVVSLEQGSGMSTRKLQDNGWYIIHYYNEEGYCDGEEYEKA